MVKPKPTVTKQDLLSDVAMDAWGLAAYRLRHNSRYRKFDERQRIEHCIEKAFDAVIQARPAAEQHAVDVVDAVAHTVDASPPDNVIGKMTRSLKR